ncbi:MAG: MOSC domain-containing protein [Actinomycetes bacterium]
MFIVGPYEFTREDARNTLLAAPKILTHMSEGRNGAIDHLLTYVSQLLGGLVVENMNDSEISSTLPTIWAAVSGATPTLRALGHIPSPQNGVLKQLNASNGGVPKKAIDAAYIGWKGVEGDRQATRKHHGRPFQALCLWSAEVMKTLRSEGHQIFPGSAGENITVSGINWSDVRPGTRVRIGEVLCDISSYAVPCKQLAHLFVDKDFKRIHHDRDLENRTASCRVYATVVERGEIAPGDPITFEP